MGWSQYKLMLIKFPLPWWAKVIFDQLELKKSVIILIRMYLFSNLALIIKYVFFHICNFLFMGLTKINYCWKVCIKPSSKQTLRFAVFQMGEIMKSWFPWNSFLRVILQFCCVMVSGANLELFLAEPDPTYILVESHTS